MPGIWEDLTKAFKKILGRILAGFDKEILGGMDSSRGNVFFLLYFQYARLSPWGQEENLVCAHVMPNPSTSTSTNTSTGTSTGAYACARACARAWRSKSGTAAGSARRNSRAFRWIESNGKHDCFSQRVMTMGRIYDGVTV